MCQDVIGTQTLEGCVPATCRLAYSLNGLVSYTSKPFRPLSYTHRNYI